MNDALGQSRPLCVGPIKRGSMGDAAALHTLREHMRWLLGDAPAANSIAPPCAPEDAAPPSYRASQAAPDVTAHGRTGAWAYPGALPDPGPSTVAWTHPVTLQSPGPLPGAWAPPSLGAETGLVAGPGSAVSAETQCAAPGLWRTYRIVLCVAVALLVFLGYRYCFAPLPFYGHRGSMRDSDTFEGRGASSVRPGFLSRAMRHARARALDDEDDEDDERDDTRAGRNGARPSRAGRESGDQGTERPRVQGGGYVDRDSGDEGTDGSEGLPEDDEADASPARRSGSGRAVPREREESTRGNDPMFQSLARH